MGQREFDKRRITLDLSEDLLGWIDGLKSQLGLRSRGAIVEQLLREILNQDDEDPGQDQDLVSAENVASVDPLSTETAADQPFKPGSLEAHPRELDDSTAIVLIRSGLVQARDQERVFFESTDINKRRGRAEAAAPAGSGIQLPGFVRRQAREIQRSLQAPPRPDSAERSLALVSASELSEALQRCQHHWLEVYGQAPSDAVTDAAMVWLARDIWPQSDHSDGRPFTWNLAQQVIAGLAPAWCEGDPGLERVITAAGILEDPFSGNTLALRVPTLITRFVQRHRSRQKRTTSFDAIDQSMSVHGALRLLQLPTTADRPYTLKEIREAYREQAQSHHPDAGGSADAMRRLNEAYQFLKERYRRVA